jgi:hypothetical protein
MYYAQWEESKLHTSWPSNEESVFKGNNPIGPNHDNWEAIRSEKEERQEESYNLTHS